MWRLLKGSVLMRKKRRTVKLTSEVVVDMVITISLTMVISRSRSGIIKQRMAAILRVILIRRKSRTMQSTVMITSRSPHIPAMTIRAQTMATGTLTSMWWTLPERAQRWLTVMMKMTMTWPRRKKKKTTSERSTNSR